MSLEENLPKESGIYRYILVSLNDEYFLKVDETKKLAHAQIAYNFFSEKGIKNLKFFDIFFRFKELGGRAAGLIDWNKEKPHIVYDGGSSLGVYNQKDLQEFMNDSRIKYEILRKGKYISSNIPPKPVDNLRWRGMSPRSIL